MFTETTTHEAQMSTHHAPASGRREPGPPPSLLARAGQAPEAAPASRRRAAMPDQGTSASASFVQEHLPLVAAIAKNVCRRTPASVEYDDLYQAGALGLLGAAGKYDGRGDASFATYAAYRIEGAILDELRKSSSGRRSLHRSLRKIERATNEIEAEHGRGARESEVMEKAEMSADEYHRVLRDATWCKSISLEDAGGAVDAGPESDRPCAALEKSRRRQAMEREIGELPERERFVLEQYYKGDLTLRQIGSLLGVTESRICQIHAQAVSRLRSRLESWSIDL